MELIKLARQILVEQAGYNTMELPNDNLTVSLFPATKTVLFSPQDHNAVTEKLRTYVHMMKQEFKVYDVQFLSNGAFSVQFDPREDFQAVVNFIAELGQH